MIRHNIAYFATLLERIEEEGKRCCQIQTNPQTDPQTEFPLVDSTPSVEGVE